MPETGRSEESLWRIHFCTSWEDEPPDTIIRLPDEYGLIEARSEQEAREKFEADPRAKFYVEEGNWWPVPEGMDFRDYSRVRADDP